MLALAGALDPVLTREQRMATVVETTRRLESGDHEARWSARLTEDGGVHFERLWRGVTDHHIVEASFIASAEARKLHTPSRRTGRELRPRRQAGAAAQRRDRAVGGRRADR